MGTELKIYQQTVPLLYLYHVTKIGRKQNLPYPYVFVQFHGDVTTFPYPRTTLYVRATCHFGTFLSYISGLKARFPPKPKARLEAHTV